MYSTNMHSLVPVTHRHGATGLVMSCGNGPCAQNEWPCVHCIAVNQGKGVTADQTVGLDDFGSMYLKATASGENDEAIIASAEWDAPMIPAAPHYVVLRIDPLAYGQPLEPVPAASAAAAAFEAETSDDDDGVGVLGDGARDGEDALDGDSDEDHGGAWSGAGQRRAYTNLNAASVRNLALSTLSRAKGDPKRLALAAESLSALNLDFDQQDYEGACAGGSGWNLTTVNGARMGEKTTFHYAGDRSTAAGKGKKKRKTSN